MATNEDQNKAPVDRVEHAPAHQETATHRRDAAAELLGKSGASPEDRVVVTPADNARVLRKIDLVILPLMLFVYFLQGIDKSTLAYASVFGLIEDTGLIGDQYSWLGSVVYLAQLVMQFPLAWLLVKLPVGKFTSCMVAFWGITLSCMAAAHNFGGLLAARLFLGAFESSVAPAFVGITQMWWRRREQTLRISYWYAMNGFTNMFGSLITYGLGHISSPLKEYQIIFIFFGIITVVFSIIMFLYMPDSPVEAKFLNDHDKLIAIERLRMNQQGVMSREWRWDHFKESMLDIKTWCWFSLVFSISIPSGGISTFGPLIIKSFGFDSFQTILFNIPFGFVQLVATVGGSWIATKIHKKGPVIAGLCVPPIAGCVMLMVLPTSGQQAARLVGYYLISVYPGITPLIYSWSAANTAGDTKRKCTSAVLFIGQSVGNVVGPLLYKPAEAPRYTRGLTSNLVLYCVIVVLVVLVSLYLAFLNRSHSKRRVAMGKSAVIIDTSLFSAAEAEKAKQEQAAQIAGDNGHEMAAAGEEQAEENVGARAFDNLTDLENEEFVNPRLGLLILEMGQKLSSCGGGGNGNAVPVRQLLEAAKTMGQVKSILLATFKANSQALKFLPDADSIYDATLFVEMGVDSLVAVKMRSWFLKELGVDVPVMTIPGGASIADLVRLVVDKLPAELLERVAGRPAPTSSGVTTDELAKESTETSSSNESASGSVDGLDAGGKAGTDVSSVTSVNEKDERKPAVTKVNVGSVEEISTQ